MLIQDIRKASESYDRYKQKKHLYETRESYERRKWKKRNDEYNRENKKNTIFCYETSENKRYAINRGIHTIEYNRQYLREKKFVTDTTEKNKIVLIFGKKNDEYKGILKIATRVKKLEDRKYEIKLREITDTFIAEKKSTLEIPEIIEIEGMKYDASEIRKILIAKNVDVFEM